MNPTLQSLIDLGFSPMNAILIAAILALWANAKRREKADDAARKAWHAETREEVAKLNVHVTTCQSERTEQAVQIGILKGRVDEISRCTIEACPLRRKA